MVAVQQEGQRLLEVAEQVDLLPLVLLLSSHVLADRDGGGKAVRVLPRRFQQSVPAPRKPRRVDAVGVDTVLRGHHQQRSIVLSRSY